jgi:hypothetical protein
MYRAMCTYNADKKPVTGQELEVCWLKMGLETTVQLNSVSAVDSHISSGLLQGEIGRAEF